MLQRARVSAANIVNKDPQFQDISFSIVSLCAVSTIGKESHCLR